LSISKLIVRQPEAVLRSNPSLPFGAQPVVNIQRDRAARLAFRVLYTFSVICLDKNIPWGVYKEMEGA
jgi:hypothetical protein